MSNAGMTRIMGNVEQDGTDGFLVLLWTAPAGLGGTVYVLTRLARRLDAFGAGVFRNESEMASTLVFWIVALVNLVMVIYCYKQKHTYSGFSWPKNVFLMPVVAVWFFIIGPAFFYTVMFCIPGLFVGAPTLVVYQLASKIGSGAFRESPLAMYCSSALLALTAVPAVVAGVSAVSRSLWVWEVQKNLRNLATSKTTSAAMGFVELQGKAFHARQKDPKIPILGRDPRLQAINELNALPFYVEDAAGRVLVEPPQSSDSMNPHFFLRLHEYHAQPVLMQGDDVYVLGTLEPGAEEGQSAVRPWHPPYGFLYRKFLRLFGRLGRKFEFFAPTDVFVVASGDERAARKRFLRAQYRWLAASIILGLGGTVVLHTLIEGIAAFL